MTRTKTAIEFIKDKAGKLFIKANSIATDNNESLQDVLNKPKLYMVTGTIVCGMNNTDGVRVHTWAQIQSLFKSEYGITPDNVVKMGYLYINGDPDACSAHVEAPSVYGNGDGYAVLDRNHTGNIRINYKYFWLE